MSRKDIRRVLFIGVSEQDMAVLRQFARGGSLGDAMRRIFVAECDALIDHGQPEGRRRLAVQLPKQPLIRARALALDWDRSPAYVLTQALAAHRARQVR